MIRKIRRIFLFFVVSHLAFLYGFWTYTYSFVEKRDWKGRPVGVVFFHDFGSIGGLDPETAARVRMGVELLAQERLSSLLFVGGYRVNRELTGSRLMYDFARTLGVKPSLLAFDSHSYDSQTNVASVEEFVGEDSLPIVVFISDAAHLFRLYSIASTAGLNVSLHGHPIETRSILDELVMLHREIIAWLATLLIPRELYAELIKSIRQGSP